MLSEISQRKTNTVWSHLYVESKNKRMRKGGQASDYKINKFWGCNIQRGDCS